MLADPGVLQIHIYIYRYSQMSHENNPALLSMKYWLVDRDPYFMVYEIIPT